MVLTFHFPQHNALQVQKTNMSPIILIACEVTTEWLCWLQIQIDNSSQTIYTIHDMSDLY